MVTAIGSELEVATTLLLPPSRSQCAAAEPLARRGSLAEGAGVSPPWELEMR
jgi:hypothetical protein